MTANKHTPGPWSFYTEPQPNGCPVVGSNGLLICMLGHSVRMADQKEIALANARLIAAAPELLEALKDILSNCLDSDGLSRAYENARAAIAKATGVQP